MTVGDCVCVSDAVCVTLELCVCDEVWVMLFVPVDEAVPELDRVCVTEGDCDWVRVELSLGDWERVCDSLGVAVMDWLRVDDSLGDCDDVPDTEGVWDGVWEHVIWDVDPGWQQGHEPEHDAFDRRLVAP